MSSGSEKKTDVSCDYSKCRDCRKRIVKPKVLCTFQTDGNAKEQQSEDDSDYEIVYEEELVVVPNKASKNKVSADRKFSEVTANARSTSTMEQESDVAFPRATTDQKPTTIDRPKERKNHKERKERKKRKERKESKCDRRHSEVSETNCSFSTTSCKENSAMERRLKKKKKAEAEIQGKSYPTGEELFNEFFLGAMRESSICKMLKTNEFRLYYKLPKSRREVAITLPLQIAYMASKGKVYHYRVECENHGTSKQSWHVVTKNKAAISFSSLMALVNYHKIYSYFSPETGKVETFPVSSDDTDYENLFS